MAKDFGPDIMSPQCVPLLGIVAYSGMGKTTLLKELIPYLRNNDLKIGLIKHTHHSVDVDTPGKDSYELRKAGADQTMIASNARWALMTETHNNEQPDLHYLANRFDKDSLDLILVEGFKHEKIDKIVLYRSDVCNTSNDLIDKYVIAIASDSILEHDITQLNLNNVAEIGEFILGWLAAQRP